MNEDRLFWINIEKQDKLIKELEKIIKKFEKGTYKTSEHIAELNRWFRDACRCDLYAQSQKEIDAIFEDIGFVPTESLGA